MRRRRRISLAVMLGQNLKLSNFSAVRFKRDSSPASVMPEQDHTESVVSAVSAESEASPASVISDCVISDVRADHPELDTSVKLLSRGQQDQRL